MEGTRSNRRDYAIEILRWISILAVVAHHGVFLERYSATTVQCILEFKRTIGWCVVAFFAISGALMKSDTPFPTLVSSRARRLLVPYVAVSVLSFALIWTVNRSGIYHTSDFATSGDWPLLFRNILQLNGYGPQLYFLPYLFFVTVIFRGLLQFLSPSVAIAVLFCGLCAQAIWTPWPVGSLGPGWDKWLLYTFAFALGHWFKNSLDGRTRVRLLVLLSATACGGLAAAALGKSWPIDLVVPFWIYAALKCWTPGPMFKKILDRFNPGAIFLWHAPFLLAAISVGLNRLGIVQGWNYLGSCALVVPAALCIDKMVRKLGLKGIFSF